MVKKYRVLFHGLTEDEEDFKARMVGLGAPPDTVDRMIRDAPVVLKGGLTLGAARDYAEAVQEAGGRVKIEEQGHFEESTQVEIISPIASFENFTMCPECGLKQRKGETCIRCGFRFASSEQ